MDNINEECPAMAPTGAMHRFGYNPLLSAHFCQDCGVCACPEHNMLVLKTGPSMGRVEDRKRLIDRPRGRRV